MIFIFLVNCTNLENKKDVKPSPIRKESLNNKVVTTGNIALKNEIINNQFTNAPLGEFNFIDKNLSLFFKGSYDVHKTAKVNEFTGNIDTLINFKKGNSLVRFYKNNEKIMLDSLNVSDKNFVVFNFGVDIDMNKDRVLNIFKANKNEVFSDTISIVDEEENSSVKLLFINKKLKKIIILPW